MMRRLLRSAIVLVALGTLWSSSAVEARADPIIAAAGDIACDPTDPGYNGGEGTATRCRQRATSDLLVGRGLAAVLPLGDIQYNSASIANISAVYDPTWGRVKAISHPVLGNHESTGMGYFDYFNGRGAADGPAGPRGKGYYSFDVGSWHLVALNSNCARVSCSAGSEQELWLRADLAAHPTDCTLAYWHQPRFSSGHDGSTSSVQPLWAALQEADAEILLSGHSHNYERFAPMDVNGALDRTSGIRQFVVGTGGAFFTGGISSRIANSEVAQNDTFGVLQLTLHPSSYDWQFVPAAGGGFTDSGSEACHGIRPPPPAPADLAAPVISRLELSRRRFRAGPRAGAARRGRGTTFRYRLTEAATVTFTLTRRSWGRRVGGRCRRTTDENRRGRFCIRYRRVARFSQRGVAGGNRRRFRGRIGRKRLRPGVFRTRLRATDAAGNRSRPRRVSFRIVGG